jgi:hypothetical protein
MHFFSFSLEDIQLFSINAVSTIINGLDTSDCPNCYLKQHFGG